MFDLFLDALIDALKCLPFLFLAYLLMEYLEKQTADKLNDKLAKTAKFGPLVGGLFGLFPQCGFSTAAANLYAGGLISLGTLIAIFLTTSDEMLILFIANALEVTRIIGILFLKLAFALFWGFLIDFLIKKKPHNKIEDLCERAHCHCDEDNNIFKAALIHSLKIFVFILIVNFVLNFVLEGVGLENIENWTIWKSFLAYPLLSLIGMIPNCASSVVITELYLHGIISLGLLMAGLFSGSGLGILVLFRVEKDHYKCLKIVLLLLVIGVISGMAIDLFGLI